MQPISRRHALQLGGLGALGVAAGAVGLSRTGLPWSAAQSSGPASVVGADVVEPETVRSVDGLLRVELVAARRQVEVAGRQGQMLTYNGAVPGQSWRVRPGDRIEVGLVNRLDTATNLHTHGLMVSPQGSGDNPFVSIAPGERFDYRFDLPQDHPTGVFWYHPHRHGTVADQVSGGLYGAIIVEADTDTIPVSRERTLIVSDLSLTADGHISPVSPPEIMMGREGEMVLVNGQRQPRLSARAGERERWRVLNACTSRYLRLALPGQDVELLGVDSGHEPAPRQIEDVLLAPGNRADLLVTLSTGTSELRSLGHDRGMSMMGQMHGSPALSGPATLASLIVTGDTATPLGPVPTRPAERDVRGREVAQRRQIAFTMDMGGPMMGSGRGQGAMGFDGRAFDPDRVDQQAAVGAVEEWTIINPTPMDHPFHLHVWPMQLIEQDGAAPDYPVWRDVINVPAHGRVRVLVDFSRHPGRSVYHCHILDHEDAGMMGAIEVGGGDGGA